MDRPETTATQLATLSNAWEKLEERKRILRMKPLPKAIAVEQKGKTRPAATFRE